jgi:hypothetical protein
MHSASLRIALCVAGALFILSVLSTALAQQESPNVVPESQRKTRVVGNYSIEINSDGVSPESKDLENDLKNLFKRVEQLHRTRLVVFVHGGLVTLNQANARAEKLGSEIVDEPGRT